MVCAFFVPLIWSYNATCIYLPNLVFEDIFHILKILNELKKRV